MSVFTLQLSPGDADKHPQGQRLPKYFGGAVRGVGKAPLSACKPQAQAIAPLMVFSLAEIISRVCDFPMPIPNFALLTEVEKCNKL